MPLWRANFRRKIAEGPHILTTLGGSPNELGAQKLYPIAGISRNENDLGGIEFLVMGMHHGHHFGGVLFDGGFYPRFSGSFG